MTWTVWDVLITVIGLLHIVGIIGMLVMVLRIIKGPVATTAGRLGDVAEKGRLAAEGTLNALNANRGHVESIVQDVQGIVSSVRPANGTGDLPINYRSLRNSLATLTMIRKGLGSVRSFRVKKTPTPGPTVANVKPERLSLPERLGLVPPVAKHLIRYAPYLRIVRTILLQMKGR
jgi:hypothetical protein